MKLTVCLLAAVVAAKGKKPVKPVKPSAKGKQPAVKAWGDDPVNTDACIYTETDGITRVTTEPGLQKLTKCYKHFRCTGGTKVQAKINQMGMGVRQSGTCMTNFVKLQYSIPRDDFMDFYHWTDHLCDEDLERGWEFGKWQNLEDSVLFSFELNDHDYYQWFYDYNEWQYEYYGSPPLVEKIPRFDIQFKCSNIPDPDDEPDTTTPVPPTDPPGPTTTTINPNYNTIDQERFLIKYENRDVLNECSSYH